MSEEPKTQLASLPLESIEIGKSSLRPAQSGTDDFELLKRSIKNEGILVPILVRPSETAEGQFVLVDGLQRLSIAQDLGLEEVPVAIVEANEAKVLSLQIQTNLHKIATKPAEYGKQLKRMLVLDPTLSVTRLAADLNVSPQWIIARINLSKLLPEIQERVDGGEIPLTNALQLAKLPGDQQLNWVKRAAEQSPDVFVEACKARCEEIEADRRKGREVSEEIFKIIPRLRSKTDILDELDTHQARARLITADMNPVDSFDAAIQWVLRMDTETQSMEQQKWEAEKVAREERKKERAERRAAEKAAKAAEAENAAAEALINEATV